MAMVLIGIGSLIGLACGAVWGIFAGFSVIGIVGLVVVGAMIGGLLGFAVVVARFAKDDSEGDAPVSNERGTPKMAQSAVRS